MNRREFCLGTLAVTAGCSAGDNEMPQEYTLQPSPRLRDAKQVFDAGVEGKWTPVLSFTTPGNLSVTYGTQQGRYTKIGRTVISHFHILTLSFTHTTASGGLILTGVPYTNTDNLRFVGNAIWSGISKTNFTQLFTTIEADDSQLFFYMSGNGQSITVVDQADAASGGTIYLAGTMTYQTKD